MPNEYEVSRRRERARLEPLGRSRAGGADDRPVRFSLAAAGGAAFANNGLAYGPGAALHPMVRVSNMHVAGFLAVHAGDKKSILWGPTSLANGGRQDYSSLPVVAQAEIGYRFRLPIGSREMALIPFAAGGAAIITLKSSGVYGESTITHTSPMFGLGVSWLVDMTDRVFVGVTGRWQLGPADADFEYGQGDPDAYQHGFKTSIWYGATFAEIGCHF